nr:autotransporter outer membrane beta-barrel domain-containing protein [Leminorella grimontii]
MGELKLGAEGQLNRNLNLWSNVAQQLGDKGYSDTAVTLGVKYRF